MRTMNVGFKIGAFLAVLVAGSCSSEVARLSPDGAENHPIVVEPSTNVIKLPFSAPEAGLMPEDSARFENFVDAYTNGGNGAISISAASGPDSSEAIAYFGERLAEMGVPRSRILVGTHDVTNGDRRVELSFVGLAAHVDACGNWSKNLSETASNETAPDFGCSVQHNIAAMVSDPRDLVEARTLDPQADETQRSSVMGKYEQGKVFTADKRRTKELPEEQSGYSSQSGGGQ
jgi:pilus assembly protein CpaD